MASHGKRYQDAVKLVDRTKAYSIDEAVALARETSNTKFDASVEAHLRLGVDPRHADQMVRGTVVLPHGTGKIVRVAVFAQGEKAQEALRAGADEVGGEDLVKKIEAGWLEFDVALATPDSMGLVGRLGKVLGRRGLMPNPKAGTITFDLERAIKEVNPTYWMFRTKDLFEALGQVKPNNKKGEYYLTDTLAILKGHGRRLEAVASVPPEDVLSINTRSELADVARMMQKRIQKMHMENGVTLVSPENTWIEFGARIGQDTVIEPFTWIGAGATIPAGQHVKAASTL